MAPIALLKLSSSHRLAAAMAAVVMATALWSCVDDPLTPPALERASRPIIGGAPESGYVAVGALMADGEDICTGTLVRPTVFVTAAHCLAEGGAGLSVFFGGDVDSPGSGETIDVSAVYTHPSYDDWEVRNDIGVALLAQAATVDPIEVQTTPMSAAWVGREPLFVGFGVTSAASEASGRKYSVRIPITEVSDRTFTYSGVDVNTCFGDSGGPALYDGPDGAPRLIGVTSWGDEECSDFGVNTRVDAFIAFLQPFLDGETPPPTGTGGGDWCEAEGWYGDGLCDPDCPEPDPDCGAPGSDWCQAQGWYGDGICDPDCPQPDSDCAGLGDGDWCEDEGWYGDGVCDEDCPQPDPDCGGGATGDWCEDQGWYGDGTCDEDCPQPDPDCEAAPADEPTPDPSDATSEPTAPTAPAVDPTDDVCRDPDCLGQDTAGDEPARDGQALGCSMGGGDASSTGLALLILMVPLIVRRPRRGAAGVQNGVR